jgi:hypothetical protein
VTARTASSVRASESLIAVVINRRLSPIFFAPLKLFRKSGGGAAAIACAVTWDRL